MAAKKKPEGEVKNDQVRVRLTAAQKEAFDAEADLEGLDTSSWLRNLGIKAIARRKAKAKAPAPVSTPTPEPPPTE